MYYIEKDRGEAARIFERVVDFFFPMSTYCVCCGKFIDESRSYMLCDHCVKHMGWGRIVLDLDREARELNRPRILESVRACMSYGPYERRLIFELKYDKRTYMARTISAIMADRILTDGEAAELTECDCIIPVPISDERMETRGFNQTEKIGRHLSKRIGVPLRANLLKRVKSTVAQKSVSGLERFENLNNAFEVTGDVSGRKILLLDDVYTTGATVYQCALKLKAAGAAEVHVLVLATANKFAEGYFKA